MLGQLAVDRNYQKQGHAPSLMLFALKTALHGSALVVSAGVRTHPLDDAVRGFYQARGFKNLPFDPHGAMFVRMADLHKFS